MELLLGGTLVVENFDEQIVFEQLDHNESAIWSLLLASGYLKAVEIEYRGIYRKPWFHLAITNMETEGMFAGMFRGWFSVAASNYNGFVLGLIAELADEYEIHSNRESGFGRYDTRFGIPKYNENGELEEYHIYSAKMLVRRDEDGKLYLYDLVEIKKEASTPLKNT